MMRHIRLLFVLFLFAGLIGWGAFEWYQKHSKMQSQPPIVHHMEPKLWAEKCITEYPELLWLTNDTVQNSEEGQNAVKTPYSEQFFGSTYIEFDRTIMSLRCLELILDGSDTAYWEFVHSQPEEKRLSKESFHQLFLQGKEIVSSHWKTLSEKEIIQAMETELVLKNMGKSEQARALFRPYHVQAIDHDDFYGEALLALRSYPNLSPSFQRLPQAAQELLSKTANLAHYGHISHLEGESEMFRPLKTSNIAVLDPTALSFDFFVHTCNVAGALGHLDMHSSLVYTEPTHTVLQETRNACLLLSDGHSTEWDAYLYLINRRARALGLSSKVQAERVLVRIGSKLRLSSPEEGQIIKKAFKKLPEEERKRIIAQFDIPKESRQERTPTYIPAVLFNLLNNASLGSSREERLVNTIHIGLPCIAKVLEQYRSLLSSSKIDMHIPLNFNAMAGLAKTNPKLLLQEFFIDEEGRVLLRKEQP